MKNKTGINESKGIYVTKKGTREQTKKYRNKYHAVRFRVPFGTKEKLYSLNKKPQEIYIKLINEYLDNSVNASDKNSSSVSSL